MAASLSCEFRNIPLTHLCPYAHKHLHTLSHMLDLQAYLQVHLPAKSVITLWVA